MEINKFDGEEFGNDEYFDNFENNNLYKSVTVILHKPSFIKNSIAKTYFTKKEFDYMIKFNL